MTDLAKHTLHNVRRMTFAGFLTVVPIAFAFYVCKWLFGLVESFIQPVMRVLFKVLFFLPQPPPFFVTLLGLLLTFLIFFLAGLASTHYLGRELLRLSDSLFQRIPIYRNVYNTIKQILETLTFMENKAFQEAVLVEYPRKGIYSVGFVTNESALGIPGAVDLHLTTVFIATTPNPTSGFIIIVPQKDVIRLNATVEEAMRFILSAGVITVNHRGGNRTDGVVPGSGEEPLGFESGPAEPGA